MIVYGTFTETSVPKLFMAGVVPGLIMTAAFMTCIGFHAVNWPAVAPRESGPRSLHELVAALVDVLPFGILIAGTLGGIYAGLVTTFRARRSAGSWRSFSARPSAISRLAA